MVQMDIPMGGSWVDLGGGTGSNLEYFGTDIERLEHVFVVDLAKSLLEVARQRAAERGWDNVEVVEDDATRLVQDFLSGRACYGTIGTDAPSDSDP